MSMGRERKHGRPNTYLQWCPAPPSLISQPPSVRQYNISAHIHPASPIFTTLSESISTLPSIYEKSALATLKASYISFAICLAAYELEIVVRLVVWLSGCQLSASASVLVLQYGGPRNNLMDTAANPTRQGSRQLLSSIFRLGA